jgi:hypothetical protein
MHHSELAIFIGKLVDKGEISHFDPVGSYKHAKVGLTVKVPLSIDAAIVPTCWLIQCYAYPCADRRDFRHVSDELHGATPVIGVR